MARYILIDRDSYCIWGDSADIDGKVVTGTPCEVARALDESIGEVSDGAPVTYSETNRYDEKATYDVYRADVRGSDAVTTVHDGQDQEIIAAVERDCDYVTAIRRTVDR